MTKTFFDSNSDLLTETASLRHVGIAPGRMDVMGGIADYSGSLVLQMPIKASTRAELELTSSGMLEITTIHPGGQDYFSTPLSLVLDEAGSPRPYREVQLALRRLHGGSWAAYPVGCLLVLMHEEGVSLQGMRLHIASDVPDGKGVSSSAALEVATLKAMQQAFGLELAGTRLPILAQMAENLVVGAPCGLMDQLASYFGRGGSLLPITCRPDVLHNRIDIPYGVTFAGIDSGFRHFVGGASYTHVRVAAFMGYAIIARAMGASQADLRHFLETGQRGHLPLEGYITSLSVEDFESKYAHLLPDYLSGANFINEYEVLPDAITQVDPQAVYSVRAATAHPIYENERVGQFARLLKTPHLTPDLLGAMGRLMLESHASYNRCGLGSPGTDAIVEMVQADASFGKHLFGAKITGGGSGGTVCVLCYDDEGRSAVAQLAAIYRHRHPQGGRLIF